MRKNSPQFMNKKHNYSIRKFTFGTASIVVGATLFFGAGQAHAAEQGQQSDDTTTTTAQSSQDNGNQDSEDATNSNDQSNQPEQDASDQTSQDSPDTSETETQNAQNSNSGNPQSEDTNDNQDSEAQNEDNTQTSDNEQDADTSTSSNDQTSSNQSSDQDNTNNDKAQQEQPQQADDNQNSENKPSNSEQTTDNKADDTSDSANSNAENNNDQNANSDSSQPQSANDTTSTNSNMKQSTSKNDENNSNSAQNKADPSAQQAPQSSQEKSPKHDKEGKDTSASSSQDTTQATQNPNSQQSTNDDGDNNQASDHNKDTFFSMPQSNDNTNSQQNTTNIQNQSDLVDHYKDQTGNQMSESDLNEIAENSDIDFDKDDQATIQQKFLESAAKDYSDKKNATTLFATPVSTTSATNQNESTSFRDAEPTTEEAGNNNGSDVSDNVHFSDLNLSGVNPNNPDNKDTVEIGNNGYLRFKGNYKLDNNVKSGDYFYVDYGDYVRPTGLEDPIVPEDLKSYNDNGSQTVATAKYDPDTNKVKYTFTDFVDQHKDVKGSFDFVAYPNRRNATDSFKDYPIDIDVAGEKYSTNLQFDYVHQSDYVSSFWDSRSQDHKHQSRTTYLNEGYHPMNHSIVTISTQGSNLSNLQIYKPSSKDQMVDSYVPNYEDLEDVTDQYDIQYNDDGTEATIDFGYDLDGQGFIINTKSDAYEDADNITETTTIENQLGNGLSDFYDYHNYLSRFMQGSGAEPDVPTNPDQPTDPTEPTNPGDPTDPTEPVNPGKPTNPGTPTDPTQPVNPGDPTNPGTPPDPTQPGQPTNPGTPTDPGTPVNPNNPNEPVNPNNPSNPQNPQNPNNPTNPNNPQNPQNPNNPNNPNQPTPGTPTTPEATHGTPGTPTSPNAPNTPNDPNTPNTPTVNPVTHHDNGVTGQHGTPGNTITVTYPDGTTTHATVNPDGTWNAPTPEHVNLKSGDTVTVVEQDAQGHTTQVTEVAVDQTQQPVRGTAQGLPESGQHESNNAGISIMAALGGILAFFGIRRRKADK